MSSMQIQKLGKRSSTSSSLLGCKCMVLGVEMESSEYKGICQISEQAALHGPRENLSSRRKKSMKLFSIVNL
ncbi:hypothetical protein QQP08_024881 [Theobroma cacao]|nr:hypothetical protein QQP08_024881 [Theobroma cacao]